MVENLDKVDTEVYTVLLENDQVRVLECRFKPGWKSPMHSHPNAIVYPFKNSKLKFTLSDGKTIEKEFKAGQVVWIEAVTHSAENVGNTASHALILELKEPEKTKQ
jgi:quercetin dioxygenase-like cupin family protein